MTQEALRIEKLFEEFNTSERQHKMDTCTHDIYMETCDNPKTMVCIQCSLESPDQSNTIMNLLHESDVVMEEEELETIPTFHV